jgi:predicted metalloendopeptidase
LGELLGRYYVQQTFSGDSKVRAQELIDRIKDAFAEHLPEVDWYGTTNLLNLFRNVARDSLIYDAFLNLRRMDKQTERAAQQKLDAVADKIGYPDKWDDLTGLNVAPGSPKCSKGNEYLDLLDLY